MAGPNAGGSILGTNLYAYCFNNPVNMSDPTGNWPRWITAAVAVVATVVAVVAAPAVAAVAATVAVVAAVTLVAQTIHYDVRQSKNTNLPANPGEANKANWKNSKDYDAKKNPNGGGPAADLHQYSAKNKDGPNVKYVSPDGKREVIYDVNDKIVVDPRDIGTYNFVPSGTFWGDIGHGLFDVVPWALFGNSDDDWGPLINIFTD